MIADHPTDKRHDQIWRCRANRPRRFRRADQRGRPPLRWPPPASVEAEGGRDDAEPASAASCRGVGRLACRRSPNRPELHRRSRTIAGESAEDAGETGGGRERRPSRKPASRRRTSAEAMRAGGRGGSPKKRLVHPEGSGQSRGLDPRRACSGGSRSRAWSGFSATSSSRRRTWPSSTRAASGGSCKRKLYPGYLLVNMAINDDTWFVIRETPGVGDFTGSGGKPTPMERAGCRAHPAAGRRQEEGGGPDQDGDSVQAGDRVRVKDGHFQNFEGEVESDRRGERPHHGDDQYFRPLDACRVGALAGRIGLTPAVCRPAEGLADGETVSRSGEVSGSRRSGHAGASGGHVAGQVRDQPGTVCPAVQRSDARVQRDADPGGCHRVQRPHVRVHHQDARRRRRC